MASTRRILAISLSNLVSDARVLRQLKVLSEFGQVTTVGYGDKPAAAFEHLQIPSDLASLPQTPTGVLRLALRMHKSVELSAPAIKCALGLLNGKSFDLVVANEARALPLAHAVSGGSPVWGDMHEWSPEERTHVLAWRVLVAPFMRYVCSKYLPKTDAVTTVNGSIAKLYEENFGVYVHVVRNSIELQDLLPSPVDSSRVRLVHSGGAVPGRNLELLIEATLSLDERYSLDFFLVEARDRGKYLARLRELAGESGRVRFHPAVTPDELPKVLNSFDVGVYSIAPRTTNHRLMLPNKFFDFVQARLALVFGPTVETTALIEKFGLGLVTRDFTVEAMKDALSSLTPESITKFKTNTQIAAPELSSREDEEVQRSVITRLLAER